jgi:hypothetical protein
MRRLKNFKPLAFLWFFYLLNFCIFFSGCEVSKPPLEKPKEILGEWSKEYNQSIVVEVEERKDGELKGIIVGGSVYDILDVAYSSKEKWIDIKKIGKDKYKLWDLVSENHYVESTLSFLDENTIYIKHKPPIGIDDEQYWKRRTGERLSNINEKRNEEKIKDLEPLRPKEKMKEDKWEMVTGGEYTNNGECCIFKEGEKIRKLCWYVWKNNVIGEGIYSQFNIDYYIKFTFYSDITNTFETFYYHHTYTVSTTEYGEDFFIIPPEDFQKWNLPEFAIIAGYTYTKSGTPKIYYTGLVTHTHEQTVPDEVTTVYHEDGSKETYISKKGGTLVIKDTYLIVRVDYLNKNIIEEILPYWN